MAIQLISRIEPFYASRPRGAALLFTVVSAVGLVPANALIGMLKVADDGKVAVYVITAFLAWGFLHVPFYVALAFGKARRAAPLLWSSTLVYNVLLCIFSLFLALATFNIFMVLAAGWLAFLSKVAAQQLAR